MRGATSGRRERPRVDFVSIHAPMRGATSKNRLRRNLFVFQSTRPCGARRKTGRQPCGSRACFNPRAHAGRDQWGAKVGTSKILFQSTRPCGARRVIQYDDANPPRFNPRAHAGRDRLILERLRQDENVSIHAPMRGATSTGFHTIAWCARFNPRAHAGRDGRHCFGLF